MRKLIISDYFSLNNDILLSLINAHLEHLEIELLNEFLDTSNKLTCFQQFNKQCPQLKHLSISNCQQIDMMYFYSLTYLETIYLVNCYKLSNIFLDFVKESKLRKLVIYHSLREEDVDKNELRRIANEKQIELILFW